MRHRMSRKWSPRKRRLERWLKRQNFQIVESKPMTEKEIAVLKKLMSESQLIPLPNEPTTGHVG